MKTNRQNDRREYDANRALTLAADRPRTPAFGLDAYARHNAQTARTVKR